jgi:hypothetical protein
MKTMVRSLLAAGLLLAAAGCAAGGAGATGTTGASGEAAAATPGASNGPTIEITDTVRLILGTMKLGDAGLAPDKAEAAKLIPLWQAYESLGRSDTTAPQELDALITQIRGTMTSEQLKAIDSMTLTQEDVRSVFNTFRQDAGSGNGTTGNGSGRNFQQGEGFRSFGGGDGPFVGPPGGGGFGGESGAGLSPQQLATAEAQRANRSQNGSRSALFLVRPLLANLQALAGA